MLGSALPLPVAMIAIEAMPEWRWLGVTAIIIYLAGIFAPILLVRRFERVGKRKLAMAAAIAPGVLLLIYCGTFLVTSGSLNVFLGDRGGSFWRSATAQIDAGAQEVRLSDLTDFKWDAVCVLPPYALNIGGPHARLKQYLPYELGEFEGQIPALADDGQWAFAFVKSGRVIALERRGRGPGISIDASKSNCLGRATARFVKEPITPHGDVYLRVTGE